MTTAMETQLHIPSRTLDMLYISYCTKGNNQNQLTDPTNIYNIFKASLILFMCIAYIHQHHQGKLLYWMSCSFITANLLSFWASTICKHAFCAWKLYKAQSGLESATNFSSFNVGKFCWLHTMQHFGYFLTGLFWISTQTNTICSV